MVKSFLFQYVILAWASTIVSAYLFRAPPKLQSIDQTDND